jgi:hypothetical protein
VAERKEEEDEGRGPCVSEGEGRREAGWAEPAGKPRPKRSGEGGGLLGWWRGKWAGERRVKRAGERRGEGSGLTESQGPGGWAEIKPFRILFEFQIF